LKRLARLPGDGLVLFALGLALFGGGWFYAGELPSGGAALVTWPALVVGLLRLITGTFRPAQADEETELADDSEPEEPDEPPEISVPPMNAFEYDYWLLGLRPEAPLKRVRHAYWLAVTSASRDQAVELYAAYRRIRRASGSPRIQAPVD
jgi:hypothetical protein